MGCEKVIFVRAFAGEAESQAVGLALMRHKRTDQVTICCSLLDFAAAIAPCCAARGGVNVGRGCTQQQMAAAD